MEVGSGLRRFWSVGVILGICIAVAVIGGNQREVTEYRVVTGWTRGPFISDIIGDSSQLGPAVTDLAALIGSDGEMYVAWIELREYGAQILFAERGKEDQTWKKPQIIPIPEKTTTTHNEYLSLFKDSTGRLWLACSLTIRGSVPSQIWVSTRTRGEDEWSVLRQVTRTEDWYSGEALYDCYRPSFAERNGTVWLFFISNKDYQRGWIWRIATADGGKTWTRPQLLPNSPFYEDLTQTSDGSLWAVRTDLSCGYEKILAMQSGDLGETWFDRGVVGTGGHPKISQVSNSLWVVWQSEKYTPTVLEKQPHGAGGKPYVWEHGTTDLWFSRLNLSDTTYSWSAEAKLLEEDGAQWFGVVVAPSQGKVELVYLTSEGLEGQNSDLPCYWRIRVARNTYPSEPLPVSTYREKRIVVG